ncbi:mitochondrial 2oxodicarboxylate carrier 1, putative [Acanthamoeba castellanii str. Neff]|uniref:Mitochondrial 2oxodicarboxylate carrier 1, putative n=1 Tax=Acanthamoeba castellanii (strain ATCC 30010 / Neff) TaxID=1257118 RepID=L8GVG8_ACACF|nr:mitochondrial 2oxodicarboxylate carrier 1, putative [Acanthamoeba castellanii str. Neff]ELR17214.1 mitochondrial 2oxodicarboxylate carrier 1, putative [Acanthamoeba castellanii str. Neff]
METQRAYSPVGASNLPFHKQVMAGALAGLCEVLCMYPLDVVKTRFQLQTAAEARYSSVLGTFRDIIKTEGFSKLYRGIASPIMAEAPKRAMKFSMNEQYKKLFTNASGQLSGPGHVAAGGCAGMTEALVNCPFELVKVRMQARSNAGLYKNTWHAARSVIQTEGALTLYRGFGSMLWRNGVWNGAYFGIIQQVKRLLPVWSSERGQLATNFTAGTISGLIATMLNTPFDVVKSRIQNTLPGQPRRYTYTLPALATVAREEGFAALYKGFVPKVLRLAPGGGIMLVAFDFFARIL